MTPSDQPHLALRPATLADAGLLLAWRNDPDTRSASKTTHEIGLDEHLAWLARLLANPGRRLMIAEADGVPCGSVRADLAEGVWELSWTIAPSHRGRGFGAHMVRLLAQSIAEPVRAEVKAGNRASMRIAEAAGMRLAREADGILYYARPARTAG